MVARCWDLGDRVVDVVAGEGVGVGLAVADGHVGLEALRVAVVPMDTGVLSADEVRVWFWVPRPGVV